MNHYKSGNPDFKKGSSLHKAHVFTAHVVTAPTVFVHSQVLTLDFTKYLENEVPSSPVLKNWSDLKFTKYNWKNASRWWDPQTRTYISRDGRANIEPAEKSAAESQEPGSPQKGDQSSLAKEGKASRLEWQAMVMMAAGAEVFRDEIVASWGTLQSQSRPASPAHAAYEGSPGAVSVPADAFAQTTGSIHVFKFNNCSDKLHTVPAMTRKHFRR